MGWEEGTLQPFIRVFAKINETSHHQEKYESFGNLYLWSEKNFDFKPASSIPRGRINGGGSEARGGWEANLGAGTPAIFISMGKRVFSPFKYKTAKQAVRNREREGKGEDETRWDRRKVVE